MLRLLLDEHISPAVAGGLRRRLPSLAVYATRDWEHGAHLGQDDDAILRDAAAQGLTLVTYDRRTIPPLLKAWAEQGRSHGGVIFVDERTIEPSNVGAQIRGLAALARETAIRQWRDRVIFLLR
jgi:hypothetical protein